MFRGSRVSLSLFPFMSVLACTIGALTLLLLSLAGTSLRAGRAATAPSAERSAASDVDTGAAAPPSAVADADVAVGKASEAPLAEMRGRVEAAEARWAELDRALAARGLAPGADAETIRDRLREIERTAALRTTLAELEAERASLAADREAVETTIEVLESRRETLPILIDPTGLTRDQTPYFVESHEGGLTFGGARSEVTYFVSRSEIRVDPEIDRYLRRVQATPGALLVVLVRPDGIGAMRELEQRAERMGVRVARLPLPGDGELDWRLVRRMSGRGGDGGG